MSAVRPMHASFGCRSTSPANAPAFSGGLGASNSETGFKRVEIHACVFRLVCTNGLILPGNATIARRHTRDPKATLVEVRDLVREAWPRSGSYTSRLEATREIHVPDIAGTFGRVNERFDLGKPQVQEVETAYQVEPGNRLFDVVNAYTRAANSPALPLPDRAQLQEVGGHIVGMTEGGHRWL